VAEDREGVVLAVLLVGVLSAKKIYISVDMEGISGIIGEDQLSAGGAEYPRSRKLMAEDTNAAILPEDLHPAARSATLTSAMA